MKSGWWYYDHCINCQSCYKYTNIDKDLEEKGKLTCHNRHSENFGRIINEETESCDLFEGYITSKVLPTEVLFSAKYPTTRDLM